jgi:hypothetical protein
MQLFDWAEMGYQEVQSSALLESFSRCDPRGRQFHDRRRLP